jgi:hypothetical protein
LTSYLEDSKEEVKKALGIAARGALKRKRGQVYNEGGSTLRPSVKQARRENNNQDLGESAPR